jgi:hypothetical protein
MKSECIVLIPYYKNELTAFEKFSLEKGLSVLSHHPVRFISPEGLVIAKEYEHVPVERFEKKSFQSLQGYNQLLLSEHFYARFLEYNFHLIYQLDALVFRDELDYWCSLGYDYYGAPWTKKTWGGKYFNLFGLIDRKVGNGGFSLRKTATFHRMAKRAGWIKKYIKFGEDVFWCNYGFLFSRNFRIIGAEQAIKFAFETEPAQLFIANNKQLPFGCHAFEKNDLSFWKQTVPGLP